jgi:hypothetical protein
MKVTRRFFAFAVAVAAASTLALTSSSAEQQPQGWGMRDDSFPQACNILCGQPPGSCGPSCIPWCACWNMPPITIR